ncbi:heme/copper-type cytochrome/quinol oxidase subunit 3 [Bradyrhizobium sp. F1.13.1]
MGVFLAVVGSLFALFISAYSMRMNMVDWRTLPVPALLWFNTGVLVLSSVALQWAYMAARRDDIDGISIGLCAGGASAITFLVGQLLAWRQLSGAGYFLASNPANSFFYLITAVHGLHLMGGLVALGRTTAKVLRGAEASQIRLSVELCTIYWHFLLLVWLVLVGPADRLDRQFRRHLSPVAELGRQGPDGRNGADKQRRTAGAACRLARHRRRLVLGSARLQERFLGEGHDVDLPPQRHLHLQLFPVVVHDGANVHDRAVAQSQRGLRPHDRGKENPAHPDCDHDLHPDQQQWDDGDGRQLRLFPRPREDGGLDVGHSSIRRNVRRNASL